MSVSNEGVVMVQRSAGWGHPGEDRDVPLSLAQGTEQTSRTARLQGLQQEGVGCARELVREGEPWKIRNWGSAALRKALALM